MENNGVDSGYEKKKEDMQNPFNLIIVLVAEPWKKATIFHKIDMLLNHLTSAIGHIMPLNQKPFQAWHRKAAWLLR